jgi:soluble lytic murein transglycosylase-like protein
MRFEKEIKAAAERHNIPCALLTAQVEQESSFNPSAVSPCGARGLLQLMPLTGREMGLMTDADFFDPEKNLNAGAGYLRRQYKGVKFLIPSLKGNNACIEDDHWMMALAAYNGGLGYVYGAIHLCLEDHISIRWANVSFMLRDLRCMVRGKHPDYKQINNYVEKIFTNYKNNSPQSPLKLRGEAEGGAL